MAEILAAHSLSHLTKPISVSPNLLSFLDLSVAVVVLPSPSLLHRPQLLVLRRKKDPFSMAMNQSAVVKLVLSVIGLCIAASILGPPLYWHFKEGLAVVENQAIEELALLRQLIKSLRLTFIISLFSNFIATTSKIKGINLKAGGKSNKTKRTELNDTRQAVEF
ncbi:hypothetical protein M5689_010309 [Euphorbia peplus]|nr:hypothetical protein M5689_010309 [Euphorbia peplus]